MGRFFFFCFTRRESTVLSMTQPIYVTLMTLRRQFGNAHEESNLNLKCYHILGPKPRSILITL